ncbi:hypothetical protein LPJ59_001523 [Coemansia sp. RSA 2399]|nr:hypothetical protein LPJ59_001523 [Coemansia sp. RSA 2399]KAJ1905106.1 hypothetical protein LPJ81_002108 [Coemansia sp. IMI 209127]
MHRAVFQRASYTTVSFMASLVAGKMNAHQPRLQTLAKLIPPLTYNMRKGDCGRVAIVGGCEEYTGAPYFVASSSLRLGTDIAYLICAKDASTAIKSYTPDIIVLPYLQHGEKDERVAAVLAKTHAVSVGSGLGKSEVLQENARQAILAAKGANIPVVLDADSLDIVCKTPDVISGYVKAVLTPNAPEFDRLCKAVGVDPMGSGLSESNATLLLARKLGGVTVVRKGATDVISNGRRVFVCDEASGLRRCGGQGDVLCGATVTFLAWGEKYVAAKTDASLSSSTATAGAASSMSQSSTDAGAAKKKHASSSSLADDIDSNDIPMLASYAACMLTRHASYLAYDEYGRATQASNILEQIDISFDNKFEELLKAVRPANL